MNARECFVMNRYENIEYFVVREIECECDVCNYMRDLPQPKNRKEARSQQKSIPSSMKKCHFLHRELNEILCNTMNMNGNDMLDDKENEIE